MDLHVYNTVPDYLAQKITDLTQEVCQYFHPNLYPDFHFEAVWTDREISNEEARDRIQGFQYTLDRELARYTDMAIEGPSSDPWEGWIHDVWGWRFDDDWREKHREWIAKYREYVSTPEGFKDLYGRNLLRIDLEALPFDLQRALVTRWERLWEEYKGKYDGERGFYG